MASESAASESSGQNKKAKLSLRYGVSERTIDITPNMTVKEYRDKFKNIMNIPDGAKAFSGNQELSDDMIINPGANGEVPVLEFIKKTGEKG